MIKCLTTIQIDLEFGNVGFWGEGKTGTPGEKPLGARTRTINKLVADSKFEVTEVERESEIYIGVHFKHFAKHQQALISFRNFQRRKQNESIHIKTDQYKCRH